MQGLRHSSPAYGTPLQCLIHPPCSCCGAIWLAALPRSSSTKGLLAAAWAAAGVCACGAGEAGAACSAEGGVASAAACVRCKSVAALLVLRVSDRTSPTGGAVAVAGGCCADAAGSGVPSAKHATVCSSCSGAMARDLLDSMHMYTIIVAWANRLLLCNESKVTDLMQAAHDGHSYLSAET